MMTTKLKTKEFEWIWNEAIAAAKEALEDCNPIPMTVQQHVDQLDDGSPIAKEWFVEGGVCGFAWVNIRPGNSPFANWLKAADHARKDEYYGGVTIWIGIGGQSMQRKEAYGKAMSKVLQEHGIEAHCMSRMD